MNQFIEKILIKLPLCVRLCMGCIQSMELRRHIHIQNFHNQEEEMSIQINNATEWKAL